MIGTITKQRNHYEMLGLTPAASDQEIAQAFAKAMFAPHRMAEAAHIGMAYEVLRDPARRRAYDEAHGLARPTRRPVNPAAVSFRISARASAPTIERPATPTPPPAPSLPPAVERPVGSFIAQSLREPPQPQIREPAPEPPSEPAPQPQPEAQAPVVKIRTAPVVAPDRLPETEVGEAGLSRVTIAAGALVLAVVTLGAWAGVEAGDAAESAAPADAVTAALPEARPAPGGVASVAAIAEAQPRTLAQRRADPPAFASLRTRRAAPVDDVAAAEPTVAQAPRHRYYETMAADGTTEIAVEELAKSDAAPAQAVAAALPLSNSTIARTIHHIGYGCGQVTSTTAVEGGSGVYKVTCASGQSYRAAPVRGRYHFRRWSQ